jgi:hypothetical protein
VAARLQQRADIAAERDQWQAWQQDCDVSTQVFLDETGITTDMLRGYGIVIGGARYVNGVSAGHWMTYMRAYEPIG